MILQSASFQPIRNKLRP